MMLVLAAFSLGTAAAAAAAAAAHPSAAPTCHLFPGEMVGSGLMPKGPGKQPDAGSCCAACGREPGCAAWSWHKTDSSCFMKDNAKQAHGKPDANLTSGLHPGPTCVPNQHPSMCPAGAACPDCKGTLCPCDFKPGAAPAPPPPKKPLVPACTPPHDKYKFCDTALPTADRVDALMAHVPDAVKPNLLTARGGPNGLQNLSGVGVPPYYWGTNCLHSVGAGCTPGGNCPTNFPSGPSMAATVRPRTVPGPHPAPPLQSFR